MTTISRRPAQCRADLCRQGKSMCPCPYACEAPEDDDDARLPMTASEGWLLIGGLLTSAAFVLSVAWWLV